MAPRDQKAIPTARTWPHPIPARVRDGANPDLFVMTLGDVTTPLADGTFDPVADRVTLRDGSVLANYYRDTLGVKYYQPIDKSIFPLPPSGLCTWYYYYQDVNEQEVRKNAEWIARNLKDYGAQYVQIDDGWQKETAEGRHGSRDWTGVDAHFPAGMASLAAYIKSLGLTPGIWIAPHGQSNEQVVKSLPGVFLLKPDGTSASESWEGRWLIDPSAPEAHTYLADLFATLVKWGYEYFKIDGQTVVMNELRTKGSFARSPADADVLYRRTLETIRKAIGPSRYLLGCWGIPLEGVGYMNGSRTGGDIVGGWPGFATALAPTLRYYYQHNIVWYTDPDVMLLRPPLTIDQARVWATLQGLTGQALMASDRLMDLSDERVEIMRRVYPAVDIRPLDLFPARQTKRTWDLKVNHLGRTYDVVGLFNFDEGKSEQAYLKWKDLGLDAAGPVHVFDFWNREYMGAWENGIAVTVSPTSVRVLTVVPATDRVQLVSTNRHITQGWVDLVELRPGSDGMSFSGRSRVIRNDPYELHFAFPRGKHFAVATASATATATAKTAAAARFGAARLPVQIANHQGWATVRIDSPETTEVAWEVKFAPDAGYTYPTQAPGGLQVERVGLDGATLRWNAQYYLNVGYQVYLDGRLLGHSGATFFPLRGLDPKATYTAEVRAVWDDGSIGPRHQKAEIKFTLASMLPDELRLSGLEPVAAAQAGGRGGARGGPVPLVTIAGKRYEGALGARAGSEVAYEVKGLYSEFVAAAGVSDGFDGSISFSVAGDGRELWTSGPLKKSDAPVPVRVPVAGVQRLVLRCAAVGDQPAGARGQGAGPAGRAGAQGAWLDARLAGLASK
ncbi:MAG: NPCBM/NEW2 domain-containing protein [Vicinamibacterales bacterium]